MSNVVFNPFTANTASTPYTGQSSGQSDSGTGSGHTDSGSRSAGTDDYRNAALARIRAKSADIRRRRVDSYVEAATGESGTYRQEDGSTGRRLRGRMAGSSADIAENGVSHRSDGGLHGSTRRTDRQVGNSDSGVNPASGRPGESGSGRDAARTIVATEDNVIVVGPEDVPPQPKKRGRPKKTVVVDSQPTPEPEPEPEPEYESGERPRIINPLTLFRSGSPLTVAEANTLRPFLIEAIRTYSDYADDAITHSNRAHAEAHIWSTMDDSEIACIVDAVLTGGRKSAAVAYVARETVRIWRMVQVGVIMVPRWFATMRFYAENGGFGLW